MIAFCNFSVQVDYIIPSFDTWSEVECVVYIEIKILALGFVSYNDLFANKMDWIGERLLWYPKSCSI